MLFTTYNRQLSKYTLIRYVYKALLYFHYLCAPCFCSVSAIIYFTVLVDRFSTATSLSFISVQCLAATTKQYKETCKPWG